MHANGSSPGPHPEESDLHLRDFLNLVRRNLLLIAALAAAVVGATVWYTWTAAPVYEARATIHVDRERQPVAPSMDIKTSRALSMSPKHSILKVNLALKSETRTWKSRQTNRSNRHDLSLQFRRSI